EKLRRFKEEVGSDPGYDPAGYLWLARSEGERDALAAARRIQEAEGLTEAVLVDPDEIARLSPAVRIDGLVGGAFCPTDGFIRPRRILEGYLAAAERLGVRVEWGIEVVGLGRAAGGRITDVETSRGRIAARAGLTAAGAWAA